MPPPVFIPGMAVVLEHPIRSETRLATVKTLRKDGSVTVDGWSGVFTPDGRAAGFPGVTLRPATEADIARLELTTLRHLLSDLPWRSKARVSDKQVREVCRLMAINLPCRTKVPHG